MLCAGITTFTVLRDATPEIETYGLANVDDAYERMQANEARFRVLEP